MTEDPSLRADRRRLLRTGLAGGLALAGIVQHPVRAAEGDLPATPACDDGDMPTPPQTAGPFYTPNSPERRSLREAGMAGAPLVIQGFVLTRRCQAIDGALLDFWHADDSGAYDNEGYRLRGHQFADEAGRFRLETILPGLYPGRTRHIHVRVQPPGGAVLTTQLYFPDEPQNERDFLFRPELLMAVEAADGERRARFDFILDPA